MEQYRAKIEEHADVLEKMGFSPVGARIYIYLLYAPDHQSTFDDLVNYFKVSKSAISNGLKYLETIKLIISKTMHGQRKRYFKMDLEANTGADFAIARLNQMRNMLEDIVQSRKDDKDRQELQDLITFYKMMAIEYPILLERWRRTIAFEKKDG